MLYFCAVHDTLYETENVGEIEPSALRFELTNMFMLGLEARGGLETNTLECV